jgi:hypothetical protein
VALAVLLTGMLSGTAALAEDHKTYRCKVADVVTLSDDGRLKPDGNPKTMMRQLYDGFVVDTQTGAVTYADGQRRVMSVVQRGGMTNEYVLVPQPSIPLSSDRMSAVAASDFIRIRAGSENPTVRFLAFGLEAFASGLCESVR